GTVELVDHFCARQAGRLDALEAPLAVAVDHHAVRQRTQVGSFAGSDEEAEVLVRAALCRLELWPAVVASRLEVELALRAAQGFPREAVGLRLFLLPQLADPAHELVAVKVAVAAVGRVGEHAVVEAEQAGIGALGRTRG